MQKKFSIGRKLSALVWPEANKKAPFRGLVVLNDRSLSGISGGIEGGVDQQAHDGHHLGGGNTRFQLLVLARLPEVAALVGLSPAAAHLVPVMW